MQICMCDGFDLLRGEATLRTLVCYSHNCGDYFRMVVVPEVAHRLIGNHKNTRTPSSLDHEWNCGPCS